jgi:tetratricopeptide (TPR) repeat protein
MPISKIARAQETFDMGHFELAVTYAKEALATDKKNWEILNFLGAAYANLGEYDEGIKYFRKALKITKKNGEILSNLGAAYQEKGKHSVAKGYLEQAVSLEPDNSEFQINLALLSFQLGDQECFVQNFASRPFSGSSGRSAPEIAPEFTGEVCVSGKHILMFPEQGIGDEIFFMRLASEFMKKYLVSLTVLCDKRLVSLFSRSFMDIEFVSSIDAVKSRDDIKFEMPMGDLMLYLEPRPCWTYPPELVPEHSRNLTWKKRVQSLKELGATIGISWRGGGDHRARKKRSIELLDLVMALPEDAQLINLQYDYDFEELRKVERQTGRRVWAWDFFDPKYDIENLAALISNLDAVVTVDNTTVHLSGALNVPTIVFLPVNPDFRWGLQGKCCDFYPAVTCVRQESYADWSVLGQTRDILEEILRRSKP